MLEWKDISSVLVSCDQRVEMRDAIIRKWPTPMLLQIDNGCGWRENQTRAIEAATIGTWVVVCEDDVELGPELPMLPDLLCELTPSIGAACLYCTDKKLKQFGWIPYRPFTSVCNVYRISFALEFAAWLRNEWWPSDPPYGVGWALRHFLKIKKMQAVRSMPSLVQHTDAESCIWKKKPKRISVSYEEAYEPD